MKQITIAILFSIIMTANTALQAGNQPLQDEKVAYFESKVSIPSEYQLKRTQAVEVNKVKATLYRYEKDHNQGLGSEHFSFIVTDAKPYKILGFTQMDSNYSSEKKQLSKSETEKIAKDFLVKIDPELNKSLTNLWIEAHDEQISINGQEQTVRGMKYKCHRKAADDYTWVIVAGDGSIITFERDILWAYEKGQRISEKFLHDSWLLSENKKEIRKTIETSFLHGILNELNTEDISKGFHPDFAILMPNDKTIYRLPLERWKEVVESYKSNPERVHSGERNVEYALNILDITNNVAVVKIELFRKKQLITTDYMFVSHLSDGWKIISKTSNEHVTNPFNI